MIQLPLLQLVPLWVQLVLHVLPANSDLAAQACHQAGDLGGEITQLRP